MNLPYVQKKFEIRLILLSFLIKIDLKIPLILLKDHSLKSKAGLISLQGIGFVADESGRESNECFSWDLSVFRAKKLNPARTRFHSIISLR